MNAKLLAALSILLLASFATRTEAQTLSSTAPRFLPLPIPGLPPGAALQMPLPGALQDPGVQPLAGGQIAGIVYFDLNNNNVHDLGESVLSGWQVTIRLKGTTIAKKVYSDASGFYDSGIVLAPAKYVITARNPANGQHSRKVVAWSIANAGIIRNLAVPAIATTGTSLPN